MFFRTVWPGTSAVHYLGCSSSVCSSSNQPLGASGAYLQTSSLLRVGRCRRWRAWDFVGQPGVSS